VCVFHIAPFFLDSLWERGGGAPLLSWTLTGHRQRLSFAFPIPFAKVQNFQGEIKFFEEIIYF